MTRVRARSNPNLIGTIVGDAPNGDVMVEWDGEDGRWRIQADRLETIKEEPHNISLALLDMLDRLRDGIILQIECAMNDVRREMKK